MCCVLVATICFTDIESLKGVRKLRTLKILLYAGYQALMTCILLLLFKEMETPGSYRYRATGASYSPEWWSYYCRRMKVDGFNIDPTVSRH